jgi:hypothetical protein
MHKSASKCNETLGKWCKNKHGASKIMDTFETYQQAAPEIVPTPPTAPEAPAPTRGASASAEVVTEPHRVGRLCGPSERYGDEVLLLHNDKPTTFKEAMMGPDSIKWLDAIKSMIEFMYENQVWNLVDPPEGMMSIKRRWIYKETAWMFTSIKVSICQKIFMTKFKRLTITRLDL